MSANHPVSAKDMIAWLRANPDEPFYSIHSGGRLIIGTRNDEGELMAWDCEVRSSAFEFDREPRDPSEGEKT